MAPVRAKSTSIEVRRETARRTGNGLWDHMNSRYWQEFLEARSQFLSLQHVPAKPSITEKIQLEEKLVEWIKNSSSWWQGDWSEYADLVQWHVRQWLKARKQPDQSQEADNIVAPLDDNPSNGGRKYYDPTRDSWKIAK